MSSSCFIRGSRALHQQWQKPSLNSQGSVFLESWALQKATSISGIWKSQNIKNILGMVHFHAGRPSSFEHIIPKIDLFAAYFSDTLLNNWILIFWAIALEKKKKKKNLTTHQPTPRHILNCLGFSHPLPAISGPYFRLLGLKTPGRWYPWRQCFSAWFFTWCRVPVWRDKSNKSIHGFVPWKYMEIHHLIAFNWPLSGEYDDEPMGFRTLSLHVFSMFWQIARQTNNISWQLEWLMPSVFLLPKTWVASLSLW